MHNQNPWLPQPRILELQEFLVVKTTGPPGNSWIFEPKLQELLVIPWASDLKTTGTSGNFMDF